MSHIFTFNEIQERLTQKKKLYQKRGGGVADFEAVVCRSTTITAEIVGEGGHAANGAQSSASIRWRCYFRLAELAGRSQCWPSEFQRTASFIRIHAATTLMQSQHSFAISKNPKALKIPTKYNLFAFRKCSHDTHLLATWYAENFMHVVEISFSKRHFLPSKSAHWQCAGAPQIYGGGTQSH